MAVGVVCGDCYSTQEFFDPNVLEVARVDFQTSTHIQMVQPWLWVSGRSAVESLVHNQAGSGCYDAVGTDDIAADDDLD